MTTAQWEVPPRKRKILFGEMLVFAILSLIAAAVLSIEAITLAKNPDAVLSCSFNTWIDCAKVGSTWQANVLGFPNAFLGLVSEPVVMTIAVASLAGVRFPRWFMFTAQAIYLVGLVFAYWLFTQSMWDIGALCPWCLVITLGTTLVFMTLLHHNILHDNLYLSRRMQERALAFVRSDADLFVTISVLVTIAALIVSKYGTVLLG